MTDKGGARQGRDRQRRAQRAKPARASSSGKAEKPAVASRRRPRHTDGEWEALLREAEARAWDVSKGKKYYRCKCGCPAKHWIQVQLTPSSSRSLINKRKQFERSSCWNAHTETKDEGR
jgi:hypothetical protein